MKTYDETTGAELSAPDLEAGYLYPGQRLVAHHEVTEATTHLELMPGTVALNGGKGLRQIVVDEPARPAWDEYEDCQYYHAYTAEELAERAAQQEADAAAQQAQADAEAAARAAEAEAAARLDRIDAQSCYTAMMTDTLLEEVDANV